MCDRIKLKLSSAAKLKCMSWEFENYLSRYNVAKVSVLGVRLCDLIKKATADGAVVFYVVSWYYVGWSRCDVQLK